MATTTIKQQQQQQKVNKLGNFENYGNSNITINKNDYFKKGGKSHLHQAWKWIVN